MRTWVTRRDVSVGGGDSPALAGRDAAGKEKEGRGKKGAKGAQEAQEAKRREKERRPGVQGAPVFARQPSRLRPSQSCWPA